MENYINTDHLPRDNRGKISWKNSIGMIIDFSYNDVQGEFKILNREKDDLTVEYNGEEYTVLSYNLMKCQLRNIVTPIVDYFLYDVGDIVKHRFGEYEILDRFTETKNGRFRRFYKTICSNCGDEKDLVQDIFMREDFGCRGCSNKVAIVGKNTIYDLHKWALEYISEDVAKSITPRSSMKRIDVKCPNCGNIKNMSVSNFTKHGMSCQFCSDGISFPEKLLNYIFKKSGLKYIYQYTCKNAEWVGNYRYDFVLHLPIGDVVCECHGGHHYSKTNGFKQKIEEIIINDMKKKELALKNNKIYVEIDCRNSEINHTIESLKNSSLNTYIDFNSLDYNEMNLLRANSIMVDVCKYHMSLKEYESNTSIGAKFNISETTVNKYYRVGSEIFDWFIYESWKHKFDFTKLKKKRDVSRVIYVFDEKWIFIGKFYGARNTSDYMTENFNIKFSPSKITDVLNGKRNHHRGFHFLEKPSFEDNSHES